MRFFLPEVPFSGTIENTLTQMASAIVLVSMLFVFFIRDVQLLTAASRAHLWVRLAAYGAMNWIWLAALSGIFSPADAAALVRLVHASPFWIASVVWHGCIWLFCLGLSRIGRPGLCWLTALFPAPVQLVSMTAVTVLLRDSLGSVNLAYMVAAVFWWAAVSTAVFWLRGNSQVDAGARFAIDFAGMANATALVLVPFGNMVQGF